MDIPTKKIRIVKVTIMLDPHMIYEKSELFKNPSNIQFNTYNKLYSDNHITISYPSTWKIEERKTPSNVYQVKILSNLENYGDIQDYIGISISPNSRNDYNNLTDIITPRSYLYDFSKGRYREATIDGNYALMLNYTYTDPYSDDIIKAFRIGTVNNNSILTVTYFSQYNKFENYFPTITEMIKSINIEEVKKYENFDIGVKFDIPVSWKENYTKRPINIDFLDNSLFDFSNADGSVQFDFSDEFGIASSFNIISYPLNNFNIKSFDKIVELRYTILKSDFPYIKNLKHTDQNIMIFDDNVYSHLYNYTVYIENEDNYTNLIEFLVMHNDKIYIISYGTKSTHTFEYFKLFLDIVESIKSVTLNTYNNPSLGVTVDYPSDWTIINETNTSVDFNLALKEDILLSSDEKAPIFSILVKRSTNESPTIPLYLSSDDVEKDVNRRAITTIGGDIIDAESYIYKNDTNFYDKFDRIKNTYKELQVSFLVEDNLEDNAKEYPIKYTNTDQGFNSSLSTIEEVIRNLKVIDISANLNLTKLSDKKVPFSVLYPLSWDYTQATTGIFKVIQFLNSSNYFLISYTPKTVDPQETITADYEYIKSISLNQIKRSIKPINITNTNGLDLEYTYINKDDYEEYKSRYIYLNNGKDSYVLVFTFLSSEYYTYLPSINNIISSFKINSFIDPTTMGLPFHEIERGSQGLVYYKGRLYFITDNNKLTIVDGRNSKVIQNKQIGEDAFELSIDKVDDKIYVIHPSSQNLTVIDIDNNYSTKTIQLVKNVTYNEERIAEMVIDDQTNTVYVVFNDSNNITTVDGSTNYQTREIQFRNLTADELKNSDAIGLGIDPINSRIFVSDYINNNITVIDQNTNKPVIDEYFFSPIDMAVDPVLNQLYVVSDTWQLYIIDLSDLHLIKSISLDAQPNNVVVNQKNHFVYITHSFSNSITVVNPITLSKKVIVVDNSPYNIAINDLTNILYVSHGGSNTIAIINGTTHKHLYQTDFKITPRSAGKINCGNFTISSNSSLLSSETRCNVIPNPGFEFSSWSYIPFQGGSYNLNNENGSVKELNGGFDQFLNNISRFFKSLSNFFGIKDDASNIFVSKHGVYHANFVVQQQIPPEFWTPFYALIPSFFVPTIITAVLNRRKGKREDVKQQDQRINFTKHIQKIDEIINRNKHYPIRDKQYHFEEFDKEERGLLDDLTIEKINESQYKILLDKIANYRKDFELK